MFKALRPMKWVANGHTSILKPGDLVPDGGDPVDVRAYLARGWIAPVVTEVDTTPSVEAPAPDPWDPGEPDSEGFEDDD